MDSSNAHRAEQHVVEQAIARGYLRPEQLHEAQGMSAPGGLLQLLAQRYLQPAHAAELGQLYQQLCTPPTVVGADAERTMEFSGTIPAPPTGPLSAGPLSAGPLSANLQPGFAPGPIDPGFAPGETPPGPSYPIGQGVPPTFQLPGDQTAPGATVQAPPPSDLYNRDALPSSQESGPGTQVGPFRVIRELARGGMGVVYEAERPGLDRRVALKQMLDGGSDTAVERFLIEARIAARLRHPNIVGVHDVGESGGNPYFAMDFIEGEDLNDRITREGPLPLEESARLAQTIALALAYAHERGVLHRDIKPANVLLTPEGNEPILTDFGLAKDVRDAGESGLTQDGAIMGTPSYMPPEQAGGDKSLIDRRADVYSLGATLYAMLVGKPPFEGNSVLNTITKVLSVDPTPPRKLRPEVTRDLEVICLKCLAKEPEERYQTAQDLADDLGRYLADEPILARPPSAGERLAKWIRRNRTLTASIVLGGLFVAVGIAGAWSYAQAKARSQGRDQAEAAWATYQAADKDDRDQRIGLALTALQQAQRWVALAPTDASAREQAFASAVALGEVAEEGQQWAFAKQAYEQARLSDPSQAEAATALLEELKTNQNAELERRLSEVRGYLRAAADGKFAGDPLAFQDAQFGILRYQEPEIVELLLQEVRESTADVLALRAEHLRSLAPADELERSDGGKAIPGVAKAVAHWEELVRGDTPTRMRNLPKAEWETLLACYARWRSRLLREGWLSKPRLVDLRRHLLKTRLGDRLTATRLATSALVRLRLPPTAGQVLIRYMSVEVDPERRGPAGVALCRVATAEAVNAARLFHGSYRDPDATFSAALKAAEKLFPNTVGVDDLLQVTIRLRGLFARSRYKEGVALAERALQLHPNDVKLEGYRCTGLSELGRLDEAEKFVTLAHKRAPEDIKLHLTYLSVLRLQGRHAEVRRLLLKIKVDRGLLHPTDRFTLGILFDAVGESDRAEAELRISIHDAPSAKAAAGLALVLLRQGRAAEAVRFLETFMRRAPNDLDLKVALARAQRACGQLTPALALLTETIEKDPTFAVAYYARGEVQMARGDIEGAISDFDAALKHASHPAQRAIFLAARGVAYTKLLQQDKALPDLEEAARLAPYNPEVLGNLALFHAARGQQTLALHTIERALAAQPLDTQLASIKGQILARLGRMEEAAKVLSKLLESQPGNVEARGNLAVTLIKGGQFAAALEHLNLLLKATPDNATALLNRASVNAQLRHFPDALRDLNLVKDLLPNSARPFIGESRVRLMQGNFKGALESADAGLKIDPRTTEAHAVRGLALLQLKRVPEASSAFQLALSLDPDDVRVKLSYLNLLLMTKQNKEAKRIIREIMKLEPGHPAIPQLKEALRKLGG
ncbi:MAG: protein kinase [Planctomycetes bacterium]|nr:protein kinase [Planctomycetota bacterium]